MLGHRLSLVFALALSLGASPIAKASVLKEMSLAEIVSDADHIVDCTVVSVKSNWDKAHRSILTTIEVAVNESWKGIAPSDGRIHFVQPGGSVGDVEMSVEGMPAFSAGERTILFLHGQARKHVVGMNQGKRLLEFDGKMRTWVVRPALREGVLRIRKAGTSIPADLSTDTRETLDSFREKIHGLVR